MIRKLELKDIEEVFELLNELYKNKIEHSIFIEKYKESLNDDKFYGIVAIEDNKVVGVLISRIINRLVKKRNILFIDDLIVNEKYRNKGIGKLLIQVAINYATSKDCETVELTSYILNVNAHRFYENNGFEKNNYKFKKYLNL
ncbi:MAG: GNAT family N-acetyltransferase [Clostridia bacterium]|jgi:predicted N-acetyltransferase YhbS|nr:GNAT family N-acetyltransferase [Clostridia bacterium]